MDPGPNISGAPHAVRIGRLKLDIAPDSISAPVIVIEELLSYSILCGMILKYPKRVWKNCLYQKDSVMLSSFEQVSEMAIPLFLLKVVYIGELILSLIMDHLPYLSTTR